MSDVRYDAYDAAAAAVEIHDDAKEPAAFKKPRRKKGKLIAVLLLVVIIAAAALYIRKMRSGRTVVTGASYTDHVVGTRDIELSLSGTGTLNPADSYTVTTLISGEILSAPFEEGDVVDKDTLLYQVDSSDVATSIEQAENNLAQMQRSYNQKVKSLDDLNIRANETGTVIELLIEEGDKITAGQTVARIRNSGVMSLEVPFGIDDAAGFYIGQSAVTTLDGTFEQLSGTISKIGATDERLDGNMLVRMVTIDVVNPGGIAPGQDATAMIGDIACSGSGTFSYKGEKTVTSSVSGEIASVSVSEGDYVTKNQLLVTLSSESLQNDILNTAGSVRDSELSLENRHKQLDNYSIQSPIAGTIIEKHYKEGDTLESGKALCTIFDLSYLTMTLNVDELDIANVEAGQPVTVTAEALPGRSYSGYVTKVNINGTTANGVTSYPVTIRIDETDGLLPGMNVQAAIVVSQSKGTAAIPVAALSRGNRVLIKTDTAAPDALTPEGGQTPGGFERPESGQMPEGFERPEGGQMPEGFERPEGGQMPEGFERPEGGQMPGDVTIIQAAGGADIPEGYRYIQVTPGISDGEYIEILDGLKAGDIIAVPETVIPEAQGMFGMMPAGGAQSAGPQRGGDAVYTERTVVVGG